MVPRLGAAASLCPTAGIGAPSATSPTDGLLSPPPLPPSDVESPPCVTRAANPSPGGAEWRRAALARLLLLGLVLPVAGDDDGVVALVRLEGELLERLELVGLQLLHLLGEDMLGGGGGVDAVGLDRDDRVAFVLEEERGVERDDARLVGLRDVGEDAVDHADEHPVLLRVARVLDDRDDVCALLRDVDQVAARAVGELDGVDAARLADEVRDVRDRRARRGAEVEHLRAGLHPDGVDPAEDGGGELGAERVPDAVLDLGLLLALALLHRDPLLAVHRVAHR
mmetsp:Transcript_14308/g.42396  ORF Transcript_14308/g.42396 Transcript_14308/m.42396 type:complete len:282 (-) Transcript_14308:213-1058(-)